MSTSRLIAVAIAKSNLPNCASLLTTPESERNSSIDDGHDTCSMKESLMRAPIEARSRGSFCTSSNWATRRAYSY